MSIQSSLSFALNAAASAKTPPMKADRLLLKVFRTETLDDVVNCEKACGALFVDLIGIPWRAGGGTGRRARESDHGIHVRAGD
jgi:hypothetical protein